jgi:hypothetical protein
MSAAVERRARSTPPNRRNQAIKRRTAPRGARLREGAYGIRTALQITRCSARGSWSKYDLLVEQGVIIESEAFEMARMDKLEAKAHVAAQHRDRQAQV